MKSRPCTWALAALPAALAVAAFAHMAHVPAGARGEIIGQFTHADVYEFACLFPGLLPRGPRGPYT